MKIVSKAKYKYDTGRKVSDEPCELYDDCPDIMTPKQAMLKMLAGGQVADLQRRAVYYDADELEDYREMEYPCDYVQMYREFEQSLHPNMQVAPEQPPQYQKDPEPAPQEPKEQSPKTPEK